MPVNHVATPTWKVLLPIAVVIPVCVAALVTLAGCTTYHTFAVDAPQPVYFGTAPHAVLPIDSAHAQRLKSVHLFTTHIKEEATTIEGKTMGFEKEASENVYGNVAHQVAQAVGNDANGFIGDTRVVADIESYIPWDTYVMNILGSLFIKDRTGEGSGQATSETMEVVGNVYTTTGGKR
jgi:hypothetical protein